VGQVITSPASRPEFIDINLDDTSTGKPEPLELDGTDGSMEDEVEITTATASSESG
jgi:hypothetical protein